MAYGDFLRAISAFLDQTTSTTKGLTMAYNNVTITDDNPDSPAIYGCQSNDPNRLVDFLAYFMESNSNGEIRVTASQRQPVTTPPTPTTPSGS